MGRKINEHGLSRYIEAAKRRQLRQEAGFGCVACGFAFCDYEHIDPEFEDATQHEVAKMAFLCKQCHGEVTAGRKSKDFVWKAKAKPRCRGSERPSGGILEFGGLNASLGTLSFMNCRTILKVLGQDLLTLDGPEVEGGPIRVNAKFYVDEELALEIEDNGMTIGTENWDVEVVSDRLTIRRAHRSPSLIYRFVPKMGIRLELLDMLYKGIHVVVRDGRLLVDGYDYNIDAMSAEFGNCHTCLDVRTSGVCFGDLPDPLELRDGFPNVGLYAHKGAEVRMVGGLARGGIFIEKGAKLSVTAATIVGS